MTASEKQRFEELRAKLKARFTNIARPNYKADHTPATNAEVVKIRKFEMQLKSGIEEFPDAPF